MLENLQSQSQIAPLKALYCKSGTVVIVGGGGIYILNLSHYSNI